MNRNGMNGNGMNGNMMNGNGMKIQNSWDTGQPYSRTSCKCWWNGWSL